MFNHMELDLPTMSRINEDGKRLYVTPNGKKYPSVTTVTSLGSIESIKAWRAKVGEEEANRISNRASSRGTRIHTLCEVYLNNEEVKLGMYDTEMWTGFKPILDDIDNIFCLESMLFSHKLEIAGTTDCIANYKGVLSVIDFKTSGKLKKKEWISSYFLQGAFYSMMYSEMTKTTMPEQIVILIAVDDENPQIFVEKTKDWMLPAIEARSEFRKVKGY
jgi:genome maintenance exonuclease 1